MSTQHEMRSFNVRGGTIKVCSIKVREQKAKVKWVDERYVSVSCVSWSRALISKKKKSKTGLA